MLPVREGVRDVLTRRATLVTGFVVIAIAMAIVLNVSISLLVPTLGKFLVVFVTILTVALAGIIGGCVSMLQRIQSAPSEGDALYNLAALTNGWRAIFLSPLYGGIFASLLFVLFAAGILNGSVFPTIHTPKAVSLMPPSPTPSPQASPSPSPSTLATSSPTLTPSPGTTRRPEAETSSSSSTPAAQPSTGPVLQIKDFLQETGPVDGISYALLIIWSFLAGFAERLVPDTLNRLVAKNQAIQGGGS